MSDLEQQDGRFWPSSAITTQQGTSYANLRSMLYYDQQPDRFSLSFTAIPSVAVGVKYVDATHSILAAFNAVQLADGTFSLQTTDSRNPITMTATAAAAKVAVTNADTQIIASNTSRRYLIIVNTSAAGQYVTLTFGSTAAVYQQGITLAPGGSYEMSIGAGNLTTQEVRGIASAANGQVSVQEGT